MSVDMIVAQGNGRKDKKKPVSVCVIKVIETLIEGIIWQQSVKFQMLTIRSDFLNRMNIPIRLWRKIFVVFFDVMTVLCTVYVLWQTYYNSATNIGYFTTGIHTS